MRNRALTEDIRDYWSLRAETYDASLGHGAMTAHEAAAWGRLIHAHLGPGMGRCALDLGCGTGTMSLLMHAAGFAVTGLDFAEPMLERARRKARAAGTAITFIAGDAARPLEPDASYDVLIARNLLWTITEPEAALAEWSRLLKPGGRLLIVDGDHARTSWIERALSRLDPLLGKVEDSHSLVTQTQWRAHWRIMAELPFGRGLRSDDVQVLLRGAGFAELHVTGLGAIRRSRWPWWSRAGLMALGQHRFAISGGKP